MHHDTLGGYDERFDAPGGGYANIDFYVRASEIENSELVILFGERNFHQLHGGTAINVDESENRTRGMDRISQYAMIRGKEFKRPCKRPHFN